MIENCMGQNYQDLMSYEFAIAGVSAAGAVGYLNTMPLNGAYLKALIDFSAAWQGR